MSRKKQKKNLTLFYLAVIGILLVILVITLNKQWILVERSGISPKTVWKEIVKSHKIDSRLDLIFVRSSTFFTRNTTEYLYHRQNRPEDIAGKLNNFLLGEGLEVGEIIISNTGRDVRVKLTSNNKTYAEVICTPNMSTSAGKICIIIDDFGYNLNETAQDFLELNAKLTFSVLPGHTYSGKIAELADRSGFEVMLHMPMESKDGRTGEDQFIIKKNQSSKVIGTRLRQAFREIPQAKGMNNHQGSSATESKRIMKTIAQILRSEQKYFIDSRTTSKSKGIPEMERAGVSAAERTVFIDYKEDINIIRSQIELLEQKARNNGIAIGIGHPRENTLTVLSKEIPRLKSAGFDFVFASSVVK